MLNILYFTLGSFVVGAVATVRTNLKSDSAARRRRWIKYGSYFVIVHSIVGCAFLGGLPLAGVFAFIFFLGALELWRVHFPKGAKGRPWLFLAFFSFYSLLSAVLIRSIAASSVEIAIYAYLVVAAFDGFSQIVGQLVGRRKFAGRVSPQKTIEGAIGGLVGGLVIAMCLYPQSPFALKQVLLAGATLCVSALIGDLMASWVKRLNHVKDFGGILPGHGGVLDRFDSFVFAGPVYFLLTKHVY